MQCVVILSLFLLLLDWFIKSEIVVIRVGEEGTNQRAVSERCLHVGLSVVWATARAVSRTQSASCECSNCNGE